MFSVLKSAIVGKWLDPSVWSKEQIDFAGTQVLIGCLCVGLLPVWLMLEGGLTLSVAALLFWSLGPFAAVFCLVKTKSVDGATTLAFFSLTGFICVICMMTGGLKSPALLWLAMVPVQAMLSQKTRHILYAGFCTLGGLIALYSLSGAFAAGITSDAINPHAFMGFLFGPCAVFAAMTYLAMKANKSSKDEAEGIQASDFSQLIAENTTDLITYHTQTGEVLKATMSARHFLGENPENLEGQGYFERVHVADRPRYMKLISDVVASGEPGQGEIRLGTVSGGFSWVDLECRPVAGNERTVDGVILKSRDIAERKRRQDELENAHKDLEELSEAKSRFLANMSHELRTPLNAIIGFSDILEQEIFGRLENEKQKEYVSLIHKSGEHLLQVVTDILDVSKIDSGTFDIVPEPFDVGDLVSTCTNIMSQQADNQGVELRTVVPDNLPEAEADPRACRQILINLISNAIKFTDEGGRVSVGVRVEGSRLAYFVRDNGIGLAESDLERVGQPFFQADSRLERKHEGTGLGISVVKGLTELHNGEFVIESALNEGTCVTVFMPLICNLDHDENVCELPIEREGADSTRTITSGSNRHYARKTA